MSTISQSSWRKKELYSVHSLILKFEKSHLGYCHLKKQRYCLYNQCHHHQSRRQCSYQPLCTHSLIHLIEASSYANFFLFDIMDGKQKIPSHNVCLILQKVPMDTNGNSKIQWFFPTKNTFTETLKKNKSHII